eukprot:gene18716-20606_t
MAEDPASIPPEVEALISDSEDELPVGWEMRTTDDGKIYYIDHNSRATQWEHPGTNKRKFVSEDLPFGWEKATDEDGKDIFIDHVHKRTTYVDPRLAMAATKNTKNKYDSSSTAMQVLRGKDMTGKTAIITGANTGIGFEIAKSLALHGCHIVMACRDLNLGRKAADQIRKQQVISTPISVLQCDLASLSSVHKFSQEFLAKDWSLDILICNAAVFGLPYQLSDDDLEMHFAVNHIGHFYLVKLLTGALRKSAPSRVVVVSSESHRYPCLASSAMKMTDLPIKKENYWSILAYNQSKLCNVIFAYELNRRLSEFKVTCNAVHPGNLVSTRLSRNSYWVQLLYLLARPFTKSKAQAAASVVYCACSEELTDVGGHYFNNCLAIEPCDQAKDPDVGKQLWELSELIINRKNNVSDLIGKIY